jgi:hypothetical protein
MFVALQRRRNTATLEGQMNRRLLLAASAFALLLTGCGESSSSPLAPDTPRMNGGYVVGGNSAGLDTTVVASGDSTSRSGGYVVGGN